MKTINIYEEQKDDQTEERNIVLKLKRDTIGNSVRLQALDHKNYWWTVLSINLDGTFSLHPSLSEDTGLVTGKNFKIKEVNI